MSKIVNTDGLKRFRQDIDERYAFNDGSYENMTVGNAEQLVSSKFNTDVAPYTYRTAGGSADIGTRAFNTLVGSTMVLRCQQARVNNTNSNKGITATIGATGLITLNGTATGDGQVYITQLEGLATNHKIFILCTNWTGASTNTGWWIQNDSNGGKFVGNTYTTATVSRATISLRFKSGVHFDNFKIRALLLDATLLLGRNNVADFETYYNTNAKRCNWLLSTFPDIFYKAKDAWSNGGNGYVPYKYITTGFNQYNPETGTATCVGGNKYQITGTYTSLSYTNIYDISETITPDENGEFTPKYNGTLTVSGGNDTDTCVHLVWSGYRNGDYEPYKEHVYEFDSSITMRGIPRFDETGNFYFDGDTYEADGTFSRRIKQINLASLTWESVALDDKPYWMATLDDQGEENVSEPTKVAVGYCTNMAQDGQGWLLVNYNDFQARETSSILYYSEGYIMVYNNSTTTTPTGQLLYKLKTPVITQLTEFQEPQIVDDFGTELMIEQRYYTGTRLWNQPIGHITKYAPNLRDKLQNLPNIPETTGNYLVHYDADTRTCEFIPTSVALPNLPSEDGNYTLKCAIVEGEATLTWEVI